MYKKPLIVFEGIEGSGKSFHINNVEKYFKKKKIKFVRFREPGGCKNSERIRNLILNKSSNFKNLTDLLLYMASRNENYHELIKKNYNKKIILIDRFIDSTMAYQHYGMNINKNLILTLNKHILGKIDPDLTFLNIVNKKNLFQRLKKRDKKNRYDLFNYNFYKKVQNGFLKMANNNKKYIIIDSNESISDNKSKIIQTINKLLKL
tara:strand:- start:497 stop:1114 length:618 start_codon:yes stop_codon:yes gene_type:complete